MTGQKNNNKTLVVTSCLCLAAVVMSVRPGLAEEEGTDELIPELIVTGSRIPRRDFSAPSPIVTLDATDIRLSGVTNVEDVLNTLPQVIPDADRTTRTPAPASATMFVQS